MLYHCCYASPQNLFKLGHSTPTSQIRKQRLGAVARRLLSWLVRTGLGGELGVAHVECIFFPLRCSACPEVMPKTVLRLPALPPTPAAPMALPGRASQSW